MTRIGLLSDTHHFLDEQIFEHFKNCDEIWHAGDFGTAELADKLKSFKPLRGVYGNIDGYDIRSVYSEKLRWKCEGVEVMMIHIGGYPPKYNPAVKKNFGCKSTSIIYFRAFAYFKSNVRCSTRLPPHESRCCR